MVAFLLIRPGATDYDEQGRIQGTLDMPLSDAGQLEVDAAIEHIRQHPLAALYCCGGQSTRQTATQIAAALELKLKKLDNMQNLNHGLWQGMLVEDIKRKQPKVYRQWQDQPDCVRPPEGETLAEARARVETALSKLIKRHTKGVVGLVIPEPLASLAACFLAKRELGDLWQAGTVHGNWELAEVAQPSLAHTT